MKDQESRMTFGMFMDKALWGMLLAIAAYGAAQIQSASTSVSSLNEKVAIMVTQMVMQTESIKDHEVRIRKLEQHEPRFRK